MRLETFSAFPVMGILRGVPAAILPDLTETVIAAGLKTVEITMNTPGAPALIRQMVDAARGRLTVGAGTVLSAQEAAAACAAGASFIVSPVLADDVAGFCLREKVPFFPGALTPQEIFRSWQSGAAMVKVFPAGFFGPKYFKEIKGPFADIPLMACGGVNTGNMEDFFFNGASAVAFGGSIFHPDLMCASGLDQIKEKIIAFLSVCRKALAIK